MDSILYWHQEEERCVKKIKEVAPDHPVLRILFSSTYEACKAYWKALSEISDCKRRYEGG